MKVAVAFDTTEKLQDKFYYQKHIFDSAHSHRNFCFLDINLIWTHVQLITSF